jgi:hypothetical protein
MATQEVTAKELQTLDHRRFDEEYNEWVQYSADHDWYEWLHDSFKCDMREAGVNVERIVFDTYPASAKFDGHVDITQFMRHLILDEKYPALYLAISQDGSYMTVHEGRYGNSFSLTEHLYNTAPEGIFQYLDSQAWEELIEEQLYDSEIETRIEQFCADACHRMAKQLEDEYDNITSVEAFIESCECNEITFEIQTEEE